MIGAGVGPRQVGLRGRACEQRLRDGVAIPRYRRDVVCELSGTLARTSSWGVKPARVRSPPLLAPSTSVIVANESNNCFEPSAFFAKAHAVLACVRVDESDLVAKDAVSYDLLGVEARGAVLLRNFRRHRRKQLRGRQLGRREGPAGERESYHAINALVVPSEGQTPRHAPR